MTWFVWVRGLRGPSPQKVFDSAGPDAPFLDEAIKAHVLAKHKLKPNEELMSLDQLERRYPAPKVVEEAST